MDFIISVLKFFLSRSVKRSSKVLFAILVSGLLFLIDDITGFSFYYANDKKIEQVARLSDVLNDTVPKDLMVRIERMRIDVFERKSNVLIALSYLKGLFLNIQPTKATTHIIDNAKNDMTAAEINPATIDRIMLPMMNGESDTDSETKTTDAIPHTAINGMNKTIFIVSSSGVYFLLFILVFLAIITGNNVDYKYDENDGRYVEYVDKTANSFVCKFGLSALMLLLFLSLSFLSYLIFAAIFPFPIFGKWWITYCAVAFLSLIFPFAMLFPSILDSRSLRNNKEGENP